MIYLSGAIRPECLGRSDLGVMLTPHMGNRPNLAKTPWGADTGCFAKPASYSTPNYLTWLMKWKPHHPTCLFATAPDVVGNAAATIRVAAPVLPLIRDVGVPAALVAQDGIEDTAIPWDAFDCLFVGGTTHWKLSEATYGLVREAKARGKWTHQGRCNSFRRLAAAAYAGYDSADGTFLAFGPDVNMPRVEEWLRRMRQQPTLASAQHYRQHE